MPDLVPVRVRDCACPDTPHELGDFVYLRATLPMEGGIIAEQQMLAAIRDEATERLAYEWLPTFVKHGAVAWDFTDEDGEPVPFDIEVILGDWSMARAVGDKAAELYADSVMAPFQTASARSSRTGRTGRGTSPTRGQTSGSPA